MSAQKERIKKQNSVKGRWNSEKALFFRSCDDVRAQKEKELKSRTVVAGIRDPPLLIAVSRTTTCKYQSSSRI